MTLSVLLSLPGPACGIAVCSQAGNTQAGNSGSSPEITTQQSEDNLKQGIEIDIETRVSFRDRTETHSALKLKIQKILIQTHNS